MANYLVTGGAGFIGSNIVRVLLDRGERVRVIDNFLTGRRENLDGVEGKIDFIEGDLSDPAQAARAVAGMDYVLHQAALPSVPRSIADPVLAEKMNIGATLALLVAAKEAKVKRVVLASSSSVYGDAPTLPKVETMPVNPLSPYAVTKHVCELYARLFSDLHGLETVSLRYFNVFGPRQDPTSQYSAVIPLFATAVIENRPMTIYGDGLQSRDFTYIDNVVELNLLAATSPKAGGGEAINGACGAAINLNELAQLLNGIAGTAVEPVYEAARKGDVKHSLADISRAEELLGYKTLVPMKEGLKRTFDWYKGGGR